MVSAAESKPVQAKESQKQARQLVQKSLQKIEANHLRCDVTIVRLLRLSLPKA